MDRASKGRGVVGYTNGKNGYTKWLGLTCLIALAFDALQAFLLKIDALLKQFCQC
jgi:hypothetical protein